MPLKGQIAAGATARDRIPPAAARARCRRERASFTRCAPTALRGGTSLRDDWTLTVNEVERKRVVDTHIELFDLMRAGRHT